MKKFFKHSGVVVGAALVMVLIVLLIASLFGSGLHSVRDFFAPLDRTVNAGMARLEQLYAYMYRFDELEAENAELRARIAAMEEEVRQSVSSNEENARLRRLLGLAEDHPDYNFVDATLISWTASGWESAFTIDKGTRNGIEVGDCVITEEGFLVGRITEVGNSTATVETILDSASGVGALVDRTGATAVAEGDYALMNEGKLRLAYIADSSEVVAGDVVMSAGKGGISPSGLVIGTVESVMLDPSGLSSSGVVLPSADIPAVTKLFIITDYLPED